jgi:hypothetical protein
MLTSLSNVVIALIELIEAEVRSARKGVLQVGVAIMFLWLAGTLLLAAIGLCVWAFYLAIVSALSPSGAALICALFVIVLSGGTLWLARIQMR